MEHIVSFLLVIAIALSAASIALVLWLKVAYRDKGAFWFALTIAALTAFLVEILIWRYAALVQPFVTPVVYKRMITLSNFWALLGGLLICYALPRFSMVQSGAVDSRMWFSFKWFPAFLILVSGVSIITDIHYRVSLIVMQSVIFSTVTISIAIAFFGSYGKVQEKNRSYFKHILYLSILCVPFIVLEAIGFPIPFLANDLFLSIFILGLCLISLFEVKKLFGQPTFLQERKVSDYFVSTYGITKREKEIVQGVVEGESNKSLGEKLFISEKTVENHLTSIYRKTGLKNRLELYRMINSSTD